MSTFILTCLSSKSGNLEKNGQLRMTYTISNDTFEITEFEGRINGTRIFADAINSIDVEINGVNKTISLEKYVDFNTSWTSWGATDASWTGLIGGYIDVTVTASRNHVLLGDTVFTGHIVRSKNGNKVVTVESLAVLHEHNKKVYETKENVEDLLNTGLSTKFDKPENNIVPIINGGTNASDGAIGLKNLFAAGNTILSPYQYGYELPEAGNVGRIFFKSLYNPKYDVNADGIVDETDIKIVAEHATKIKEITDAETLKRADIDGDGNVLQNDAMLISQYIQSQS